MAEYYVGSFAKATSTGTQSITGVGFEPKAIVFFESSYGTAGTWNSDIVQGIGFTSGATESYAVSGASRDGLTTTDTSRRIAAKAISLHWPASGGVDEANLVSFDTDGFTLDWTSNGAIGAMVVCFLAIGGDGVEAKVVNWTSPTATGNKAVTGVGFEPSVVFHANAYDLTTVPESAAGTGITFGVMDAPGGQWHNGVYSRDNVTTSDTARYQRTNQCIAAWNNATSTAEEAEYISMDTDGFTVDFTTAQGFAVQYISLCLSGVSAKCGTLIKPTLDGTQAITGVGFEPAAALFTTWNSAASTSVFPNAVWSMGASDGTNDRAVGQGDTDNQTTTNADSLWHNDKCASFVNGPSNEIGSASLDLFDVDGFTLNWSGLNPATNIEFLYLALGTPNETPTTTAVAPEDNVALNLTDGVDFEWSYSDPESGAQSEWALKRQQDNGDGTNGSEEWWRNEVGESENLTTPVTIDTSTAATATAYSNQRKIDRCQNGVLWAGWYRSDSGSGLRFFYSLDNGNTWTDSGSNIGTSATTYLANFSLFIDLDDYAHVVYKDGSDGRIYYVRGTPNAGRTAWTWSGATEVYNDASANYPDIVAHREGTGWVAHAVWSWANGTSATFIGGKKITITSGGSISAVDNFLTSNFSSTRHAWPSIDFNHTGDGKTVAGSIPHLYVAWSAGAIGSGKGIRFKKATYSAGPTWTWGTEREIDSTRYIHLAAYNANCLFDGTRVIIGGMLYDGVSSIDLVLYERDAADTTTSTYVLETGLVQGTYISYGSMSYNAESVYFLGNARTVSPFEIRKTIWTRSTTSHIDEYLASYSLYEKYISAKRGHSNNRIEFIYTNGTSSPYNVTYGSIEKQTLAIGWADSEVWNVGADTAITISTWSNDDDTYKWSVATKDDLSNASTYTTTRTINPFQWWDSGSSTWVYTETENVSTDTEVTVTNLPEGNYKWSAATEDTAGAKSSYATEQTFEVIKFERWGVVQI